MKWKNFIQRIFTEPDGNPSNKRVIASYSVLVYSFILLAAFLWMIPLNEAVVHMADVFLGTAMGTYVVGRFAEKGRFSIPEEAKPIPEPIPEPDPKKVEEKLEDESSSEEETETPEDSKKQ